MKIEIIEKNEIKIIAKIRIFKTNIAETKIPQFWDEYYHNQDDELVPANLGICWPCEKDGDEFVYGIGTFRELVGGMPIGYMETTIPAGIWAIVSCKGPVPDAIQKMLKKVKEQGLGIDDYELTDGFEIEYYEMGDNTSEEYQSELWLPVKRK